MIKRDWYYVQGSVVLPEGGSGGGTSYWAGLEGSQGTYPYAQFAQAGWLADPTIQPFYEEFNLNDSPCNTPPLTVNASLGGNPSFQVNASTAQGGLCSTGAITHYYVNGAPVGAVCSDWPYAPYFVASAERHDLDSYVANVTFSNMNYCGYSGSTICTPSTTYSPTSSESASPEDPCAIYTVNGSNFNVKDVRGYYGSC